MNIAVIRRDGLGDLLCAFPLLLYLQKKYPAAHITLFTSKANSQLIPFLPSIGKIVTLPSSGNKYWNLYLASKPHRHTFDLAISAKTSPMKLMNCFLYWLKAKERIAYVDRSWHSRLINRPILFDATASRGRHQALKGLHTVAPELENVPPELFPKLSIPEQMKGKYGSSPLNMPTILICSTTTKPTNRLEVDKYTALLNRLHKTFPFMVRIVGQKKDEPRALALSSKLKMEHLVHFPRNFDEFMVLLSLADLFFVGDGGVAHIGAALGKKVVALFGETNPIEWRPLSQLAETLYHPTHVDQIEENAIFEALKRNIEESYRG